MIIGFVGHRPNRLHIDAGRVQERLRQALDGIRVAFARRSATEELIALSALAEGSDRLFATCALDLGYLLRALLPFPPRDYERTFSDPATTSEFRALCARAVKVDELPGRLSDSKAAYEALGRELVGRSRLLVTVWDGEPAAGKGGTPEVVEHAVKLGRPVVWISSAIDRAPMLLTAVAPRITVEPLQSHSIDSLI